MPTLNILCISIPLKKETLLKKHFIEVIIISSLCDTCIVSNVTFLGPSLSQKKSDNAAVSDLSLACTTNVLSKYKQMNCAISSITSMSTI